MSEPYVTTFKDRIKRAIKAFKGEPVGSISFGVDLKRCSDCKYKNDSNGSRIFYICDRKACKTGCYDEKCNHTEDILHALNFSMDPCGYFWENVDPDQPVSYHGVLERRIK